MPSHPHRCSTEYMLKRGRPEKAASQLISRILVHTQLMYLVRFTLHTYTFTAFRLMIYSVRPSTPFSADTDTPIFCCQSNTIPIRYRFFDTLQERTWRRVTDRSKAPDAAAATSNSGAQRTRCSAAADAFDLSWTVKHSHYQ